MQQERHRHAWQDKGLEVISEAVWEVRLCPCGLVQYRRHMRRTDFEGRWLTLREVKAVRSPVAVRMAEEMADA